MLCLSIEILTVAKSFHFISLIFIFVIMYYKQEGGGSDGWVSMKFACFHFCVCWVFSRYCGFLLPQSKNVHVR